MIPQRPSPSIDNPSVQVARAGATPSLWVTFSLGMLVLASGCDWGVGPRAVGVPKKKVGLSTAKEAAEAEVQAACKYCHVFPAPDSIPRSLWRKEMELAYEFIAQSDMDPKMAPPIESAIAYFEARSPEAYPMYAAPEDYPPSTIQFRPRHIGHAAGTLSSDLISGAPISNPGVSSLAIAKTSTGALERVFISDMRQSAILAWRPSELGFGAITESNFPARCRLLDLNRDGKLDLLVAEMGVPETSDTRYGKLRVLLGREDGFGPARILLQDVGRVSDVALIEASRDRSALLVSEFGGRKIGGIHLLEKFEQSPEDLILDERTGAIDLRVVDLNQDGAQDFVTVLSQEHEKVVAFLNNGKGGFDRELLYDAGDPGFGCAGIEVVDFDGDGDQDVLLVNGDTLDFQVYRPQHQIQWLENQGAYPFTPHKVCPLPGGLVVKPVDLDNDGDLDLVGGVFLPFGIIDPRDYANTLEKRESVSLIWVERKGKNEFQPHVIESGCYSHAAVECVDIDQDGDQDLLVGHLSMDGISPKAKKFEHPQALLTIWENLLIDRAPRVEP